MTGGPLCRIFPAVSLPARRLTRPCDGSKRPLDYILRGSLRMGQDLPGPGTLLSARAGLRAGWTSTPPSRFPRQRSKSESGLDLPGWRCAVPPALPASGKAPEDVREPAAAGRDDPAPLPLGPTTPPSIEGAGPSQRRTALQTIRGMQRPNAQAILSPGEGKSGGKGTGTHGRRRWARPMSMNSVPPINVPS